CLLLEEISSRPSRPSSRRSLLFPLSRRKPTLILPSPPQPPPSSKLLAALLVPLLVLSDPFDLWSTAGPISRPKSKPTTNRLRRNERPKRLNIWLRVCNTPSRRCIRENPAFKGG
ncbi:hypothetical protein BKA63DRAFT_554146, partial [Paraphoma chrysanthemicola]